MASRSHHWFDAEKLAPGERIVRSGRVRLFTDAPPYRWEGALVLTSERIFFLPFVTSPLIGQVAFWLSELSGLDIAGRGRFRVAAGSTSAAFELPGAQLARAWIDAINARRRSLGRGADRDGGHQPRRAAG